MSPHAQELTWFLVGVLPRIHWLLGLHGNHRAEVKLMLNFLDYPFDLTNYYSTSYSQVSRS